jgi:hypothetical protein
LSVRGLLGEQAQAHRARGDHHRDGQPSSSEDRVHGSTMAAGHLAFLRRNLEISVNVGRLASSNARSQPAGPALRR